MQNELDALRLLLSKEHTFSPERRYLRVGHEQMIPLLIFFNDFFIQYGYSKYSPERKRDKRLRMASLICEANFSTFYDLTAWQLQTITKYLFDLNEEEYGKAYKFLKFIEENA
jgi:hypothetical protein